MKQKQAEKACVILTFTQKVSNCAWLFIMTPLLLHKCEPGLEFSLEVNGVYHQKRFFLLSQELKELMDPSRNMSKYRNLFTGERCYPPLVSLFEVDVSKTFDSCLMLPIANRLKYVFAKKLRTAVSWGCCYVSFDTRKKISLFLNFSIFIFRLNRFHGFRS